MPRNGKAINEYLHQVAPGAVVTHFSDKPLTIAGVRFTPKWAWSDGYRKHFRALHANAAPQSAYDLEYPYRRWLMRTKGLSDNEASIFIRRQQAA